MKLAFTHNSKDRIEGKLVNILKLDLDFFEQRKGSFTQNKIKFQSLTFVDVY